MKESPSLQVNDLVLLTAERLPPLQWPIARVTQVFPGNDGIVRNVLVKTSKGVYQRAAHKLRKLPIQAEPTAHA